MGFAGKVGVGLSASLIFWAAAQREREREFLYFFSLNLTSPLKSVLVWQEILEKEKLLSYGIKVAKQHRYFCVACTGIWLILNYAIMQIIIYISVKQLFVTSPLRVSFITNFRQI